MGYKVKPKTITVRFAEDHDLYGLEAVFAGMDIRTFLRVVIGITSDDSDDVEDKAGMGIERCAAALISWNLEQEDGTPIPATVEAFMALDQEIALPLSAGYYDGLRGVPDTAPLPDSSTSGGPSLVESVPTEALSPSLAS